MLPISRRTCSLCQQLWLLCSSETMAMCSKCHKDMILKQEQAKIATGKEAAVADAINLHVGVVESKIALKVKVKVSPNRCRLSFDYRTAPIDAINKAHPIIKASKLDKF
ncbi:hypothetical protein DCAR_0933776 [Daucus carota subsp. sativus]|uniref:Uncharacterized protein n=1 Tax=Daucus carota subsp. sativus TaxID=79200 RepID=A0AAF0XWR9_DAUCS|nr:hypothetical protein DCAR_0933776 [Daucus carota subsp. sativus]